MGEDLEIGETGGDSNKDYSPTIETLFLETFLNLNNFYFNCDLWNIGDSWGDRILISYFEVISDSFFDWKYCEINCWPLSFLGLSLIFFFTYGGLPHTGHST